MSLDHYSKLLEFANWRAEQKTIKRGGNIMYDVPNTHLFLNESELYKYWKEKVVG